MPIYRRRYPRPDATQDGATARGSLQALIPWMAGIHAFEQTYVTPKRRQRHRGYATEFQDGPITFQQANAQIIQRFAAVDSFTRTFRTAKRPPRFPGLKTEFQQSPSIFQGANQQILRWMAGMDARMFRTHKRPPRFPGLKTEFQQSPYIFRDVTLDLAKWWPAADSFTKTFNTRRRRPRKQPYTVFWPFQFLTTTAFLMAATARMADRTPSRRGEYRTYQTVFDDAWMFTIIPAPFNPALVAGMYTMADRTAHRGGEYRTYQTVFDDGWLVPNLPPGAGELRQWRRSLRTWHRSSS